MNNEFNVQVSADHYKKGYDTLSRFISYYHQIEQIRNLNPRKILEIGIGNKTTFNYLKQQGYEIESCDFDEKLRPDYVADIRNLPFNNNAYDLVVASEVLEHLPWNDVYRALQELHRISSKYVIISLPFSAARFEMLVSFPLMNKIIGREYLRLYVRIPYFFLSKKFDGQHYWEMGRKHYSSSRIRKVLKKYFTIIREIKPAMDLYHHFFILEKRKLFQEPEVFTRVSGTVT